MGAIVFYIYILVGKVTPTHEVYKGRELYTLRFKDKSIVENCYKKEIVNYIKSGTFKYE